MDVNEFEYTKKNFREGIRPILEDLRKKSIYFDDSFELSDLPTDRDRIFTSIRAIIQFSFLYPNLRVYFQLANYLAQASLIEESYAILSHATIMTYAFLDRIGADKDEFEKYNYIGFEYEHLVYLLSRSNNYSEYSEKRDAVQRLVPDIVNVNIPFICYKREMSNFKIPYFFSKPSTDIMNDVLSGKLKNDVKFVKGDIYNLIPDAKYFPSDGYDIDLTKEIVRVIHATFDEDLYLDAIILDRRGNKLNCSMKVENTVLVDYDCECTDITNEFKPCEHLRILNGYLAFVLSTYFFFGQR